MTDNTSQMLKRLLVAVVFSVAFGYIESAVVVYLRAIFHPNGFTFPMDVFALTAQGRQLLLTEIGREAATLALILAAAWLFGKSRQEHAAYFMLIFAVWDIFYYVFLKLLLNWPATLMDWDILFLIPVVWASPVLYPVLVSLMMFVFAVAILCRSAQDRPLVISQSDWLAWSASAVIVVACLCLGGTHINQADYADYFHPLLFAFGYVLGIAACVASWLRRPLPGPAQALPVPQ